MKTACEFCEEKKRTARYAVITRSDPGVPEGARKYACGWHLVSAVSEAGGEPGLALVHVLPKEK
jgi:hypothetical protein